MLADSSDAITYRHPHSGFRGVRPTIGAILGPPPRFAERILPISPTTHFSFCFIPIYFIVRKCELRLALVLGSCCGIQTRYKKKRSELRDARVAARATRSFLCGQLHHISLARRANSKQYDPPKCFPVKTRLGCDQKEWHLPSTAHANIPWCSLYLVAPPTRHFHFANTLGGLEPNPTSNSAAALNPNVKTSREDGDYRA